MSIVSRFFGYFKHKDINEVPDAENSTLNNEPPLVVKTNTNAVAMVRADEFADSSVTPEEYTVAEEDGDAGITIDDGDDMSPIIMDEHEEIVVNAEVIDNVISDPTHNSEYPINSGPAEGDEDEDIEVL